MQASTGLVATSATESRMLKGVLGLSRKENSRNRRLQAGGAARQGRRWLDLAASVAGKKLLEQSSG
jgi:hypothetical protein